MPLRMKVQQAPVPHMRTGACLGMKIERSPLHVTAQPAARQALLALSGAAFR